MRCPTAAHTMLGVSKYVEVLAWRFGLAGAAAVARAVLVPGHEPIGGVALNDS
jgi:hypothetical protein